MWCFPLPLHLIKCSLEAELNTAWAKLLELNLQGTHLRDGAIRAVGATIQGRLVLDGAKLRSPDGDALVLDGAEITGDVFAGGGFEAHGQIRALGATIKGQLVLNGAKLNKSSKPDGYALVLDRAEITGDVFAGDGFEADGAIRALGAAIKGQLNFTGAKLHNPDGDALVLDGAEITGDVFARAGFEADAQIHAFEADGAIWAAGATIQGRLVLDGAKLHNPDGHALVLEGADITGSVYAQNGFEAHGAIWALGATIKGQLNFTGAKLHNPDGDALVLDGAEITSDVFAGGGFEAHGQIRAPGASFKSQLVLNGAKLNKSSKPDGYALVLDGAEITGGVFAGGGFEAHGAIRAPGATIKGQLDLTGAKLRNPDGDALVLDRAEIAGDVFAGGGFEADGAIRALGATIKGQLNLRGAKLHNPKGYALSLEGARLSHFILTPRKVEGSIVLSRAVIDDLRTQHQPPPVVATGWVVSDLHGPLRDDWAAARSWLDAEWPSTEQPNPRRRGQKAPTSVQPWYALADVYERNGDPASARRLRFSAANKVTAQSRLPTKIVRGIYCGLVGNGYYPLLAIPWLIVIVAIGCAIVAINREDVVPVRAQEAKTAVESHATKTGATANQWLPVTAETPCEAHPNYPCMNSFAFAVNSILPPAGAASGSDWVVVPDATVVLTVGLPMLKLASWALAALLLAGVTGLLRKT